MEAPLVSVVMATFNESAEYITASIESILNQNYQNWELIIADDSTRLETVSVIDSLAGRDNRIFVLRHSERMGFVCALNEGLKRARGKYIARMDGDDISLPDRFQREVDYLERHEEVSVLGGAMNIINKKGKIVSYRNYPQKGMKLLLWSILRNPLAHPTVMFRSAIVQSGMYYDVKQKKAEDIEFWLRLQKNGYQIENLPNTILNYRVEGDLSLKRNKEQWKYNFIARKKNFNWNHPLCSSLSIIVSLLFVLAPSSIIKRIYRQENSKAINELKL